MARYSAVDTEPRNNDAALTVSSEPVSSAKSSEQSRTTVPCTPSGDWKFEIRRQDVVFEKELSTTLKSSISLGRWNGTQVVIKSSLGNSGDFTEELLHEIEVLSSLRHPDLVMFLGACWDVDDGNQTGRNIWCITEYMSGGDLERYYMKMQRQDETRKWQPCLQQVLQWSSAVARALAFLHNRRVPILHRDLKPLNLLLTKHLDVKVADLGISKVLEGRVGGVDPYSMTGGVGSWRYMAPEVVRHQQYNEKVDIFAFGLIMYFISSGKQPFCQWADPEIILKEYLKGEEPRPNVADCHVKVQGIIQAAWHVNWVQRPSAQEILGELMELERLEVEGALTLIRPCMCPQM